MRLLLLLNELGGCDSALLCFVGVWNSVDCFSWQFFSVVQKKKRDTINIRLCAVF